MTEVNSDLAKINDFVTRRGLVLNKAKSEVMIIGSKHNTRRVDFDMIDGVVVDGEQLEYCKSLKHLGVIFDENMTFEEHDKAKLQKVYGVLGTYSAHHAKLCKTRCCYCAY